MPRSEQELATLTRDFNQLRENYQTLLRKKMDAQMAERLEQRWTEDFEILDAARLPEHHVFPNRPLFILGGIVVGLGARAGLGDSRRRMASPYVVGLEDLEATVPAPVLAVLPRRLPARRRDSAAPSRGEALCHPQPPAAAE